MPERLTVKRPKPVNQVTAWLVGVPLALIVVWYFSLLEKKQDIHFENPWLNLAAHSALILVPILLSAAISLQRMEFAPTVTRSRDGYATVFRPTARSAHWVSLAGYKPAIRRLQVCATPQKPPPGSASVFRNQEINAGEEQKNNANDRGAEASSPP